MLGYLNYKIIMRLRVNLGPIIIMQNKS